MKNFKLCVYRHFSSEKSTILIRFSKGTHDPEQTENDKFSGVS